MSSCSEPTIIEYARFHSLIRDHRLLDPLALIPEQEDEPNLFEDPKHAPKIELSHDFSTNEKLVLSKEAAKLLSSCTRVTDVTAWNIEETLEIRQRACKNRCEIPILKTEHELDIGEFRRRVEPDLAGFNLPYEKVDEESDEGLAWPSKYYELAQEVDAKSKREKLEISRDIFVYMQSIVTDSHIDAEETELLDNELESRHHGIVEPVTPPLLPASPEMVPFFPSSPTARLELLSDWTSPTARQAYEVDNLLMIRDAIGPDRDIPSSGSYSSETLQLDDADIGQIYSPLKDFEELPSSPFRKRVRPDDTRVEGPLTPPMVLDNQLSQAKNVSFKEMLDEIIPNLPPPLEEPSDLSLQDIESFFEEAVAPMAENFNREVEQEQLQEADSTKRVDIPLMDFSLPVPPWTIYTRNPSASNFGNPTELDSQRRLIPEMKELHLKNHRWPGVAQLEFKLAWCPFPKELGIVTTQESIEDDGSISDFLAGLNVSDAFDSSTVTWKQEGIRVLDFNDDSDEEELQPGVFEEDSDMNSLLRKRKLELEETTETPSLILPEGHVSHRLGTKSADITNSMTKVDPIVPSRQEVQETSNEQQGRALLGGRFSALSALDNFMGVRGEILKKPKLIDSPYFAASDENQPIKSIPVVTEAPKQQKDVPFSAQKDKKPLPLPELNPPSTTRQFIVSSAILAQRRVVRQLRNLYPTADFIERDFASFNNSSAKPHQTSLDTFSAEADIIISSSTGLIWTTLQVIKQRALPGQASHSPIRDRIASLSQKYERLVVIVSEGRESKYESEAAASTSSWAYSGLDVKDCDALTGLIGFCGALEADIVVLYTGGGEYEHARWIAGVMIKYSVGEPTAGLLQDETLWELFLRRAGLNAFAAQEILAALKAPDQGGSLDSSQREGIDYGLGAFVKMPVKERVRRFERLLGGTRVLLNVSRLIDVRWQ